jgi:hypothetical protein
MDFIGSMTLKDVGDALTTEGIGTAGGILGGGFVGAKFEDYFITPGSITPASSLTDKLKGWIYNNVPKAGLWYLMRRYDATTPLTADIKKGIMGSIVLDTVVRGAGGGVPAPVNVNFGGTNIRILGPNVGNAGTNTQALIQENSILKSELNKALKQLGGQTQSGQIRVQEVPYAPLPPPWPVQGAQPAQKRERDYGFMDTQPTSPRVTARQRDYGFMGEHMSASEDIAKMFGML